MNTFVWSKSLFCETKRRVNFMLRILINASYPVIKKHKCHIIRAWFERLNHTSIIRCVTPKNVTATYCFYFLPLRLELKMCTWRAVLSSIFMFKRFNGRMVRGWGGGSVWQTWTVSQQKASCSPLLLRLLYALHSWSLLAIDPDHAIIITSYCSYSGHCT